MSLKAHSVQRALLSDNLFLIQFINIYWMWPCSVVQKAETFPFKELLISGEEQTKNKCKQETGPIILWNCDCQWSRSSVRFAQSFSFFLCDTFVSIYMYSKGRMMKEVNKMVLPHYFQMTGLQCHEVNH